MKIGAVPVPVNTFLRTDEYAYLLDNSRASALVVSSDVWPVVSSLATPRLIIRVVIGAEEAKALSFWRLIENESPVLDPAPTHRDDMALWLYSSGSTGSPKGVVHLHRNLLYCAETYAQEVLGIGPNDVTLSAARLFFAYGLGGGMTFALHAGATATLVSERPTPDEYVARFIVTARLSSLAYRRYMPRCCRRKGGRTHYDLSSLESVSRRRALPGGCLRSGRRALAWRFWMELAPLRRCIFSYRIALDRCMLGVPGTPVPGYEVRVINEQGQRCLSR
jgi:benzoate-CoA ligase